MKCPKCHYLSFDPEPRCKNCGYSFSLSLDDLSLRSADAEDAPLEDFSLRETKYSSVSHAAAGVEILDPPLVSPPVRSVTPAPALPHRPLAKAVVAPPTTELPLFVKGLAASVAEPVAPPRSSAHPAPLSMPTSPVEARPRRQRSPTNTPRKLGPLDQDLLDDLQRLEKAERRDAAEDARAAARQALPADRAGAGKRGVAAAIDLALLLGLSAAVVWLTLRWCDLPFNRVRALPLAPTAGFLLLVSVGYLLIFTAIGGQTLGKMALRIRVVGDTAGSPTPTSLTIRQAAYRELLALPSVLACGAGFLPALMGEQRALHDRLAHTRVVRA